MAVLRRATVALALATPILGQSPFAGFGSSSEPYSSNGGTVGNTKGGSEEGSSSHFGFTSFSEYQFMVAAHAVLACIAICFLLPIGGIMIRLGSSPGLWLVHGIFQMIAFVLYIAAVAIGVHLAINLRAWNNAHPLIGIAILILLIFQPFLGLIHHTLFKKYSRRTVWSYGHIWFGRIAITLGIVNGGLGLQLAQMFPARQPTQSEIIAYCIAAGVMWLLYVLAIFVGNRRRDQAAKARVESNQERKHRHQSASRNRSRTGSRHA